MTAPETPLFFATPAAFRRWLKAHHASPTELWVGYYKKETAEETATFRNNAKASKFWEAQPPGYRRAAAHYVTSAKRPETRVRRLGAVIRDSAAGRRIGILGGN